MGRAAEALQALVGLADSPETEVETYCVRGQCFLQLDQPATALAAFRAALAARPNCVDALLGAAALGAAAGRPAEAVPLLQLARRIDPGRRDVGAALAAALTDLGTAVRLQQGMIAAGADFGAGREGQGGSEGHGGAGAPKAPATRPEALRGSSSADGCSTLEAGPSSEGGSEVSEENESEAGHGTEPGQAKKESKETAIVTPAIEPRVDSSSSSGASAYTTALPSPPPLSSLLRDWRLCYEEALRAWPGYGHAHYNLGVAAGEAGDASAALAHYGAALAALPHCTEAWCNVGVLLRAQGRLDEAIQAYHRALASAPNHGVVRANLAAALTEAGTARKLRGDSAGAIARYEAALALRPNQGEALYNLGVSHAEVGNAHLAIFMYQGAVQAMPACAEAWNNLGVLYREQGNVESAVACYARALAARPTFPQALNNLAVVHTQQGAAAEAQGLLRAALAAAPAYAEAWNNLGVLQRDVGSVPEALASYQQCEALDPGNRNAGQNRLLALNYVVHGEEESICRAHVEWGEAFAARVREEDEDEEKKSMEKEEADDAGKEAGEEAAVVPSFLPLPPTSSLPLPPSLPPSLPSPPSTSLPLSLPTPHFPTYPLVPRTSDRPLRVGYVSPDLFTHSVSYFAEAPLRHHSPARVHHLVYSACAKPDAKTDLLRRAVAAAGGTWREAAALSEAALARQILEDRVDILVELTGHTANNRLGTMVRRPAPVQVTWIGYPNSTGLREVDYRLTDGVCDPEDTSQTYSEELVRLRPCFLCYTPAADAPPVAPLPALRDGFVTFGSFNALAKETPEVLAAWARILRRVPASRLILKNKPFACAAVQAQHWAFFEAHGVARHRVDLLPLAAANADHLSQYALLDVSLDPWPYAGTTTTAESLFMGVPCLTRRGRCHAHNVGVSLLSVLGLGREWVARDEDEYVDLAVAWAARLPELARLREGLRERMLGSRLCDGRGFVGDLEDVYRKLWARWLQDQGKDETFE